MKRDKRIVIGFLEGFFVLIMQRSDIEEFFKTWKSEGTHWMCVQQGGHIWWLRLWKDERTTILQIQEIDVSIETISWRIV